MKQEIFRWTQLCMRPLSPTRLVSRLCTCRPSRGTRGRSRSSRCSIQSLLIAPRVEKATARAGKVRRHSRGLAFRSSFVIVVVWPPLRRVSPFASHIPFMASVLCRTVRANMCVPAASVIMRCSTTRRKSDKLPAWGNPGRPQLVTRTTSVVQSRFA